MPTSELMTWVPQQRRWTKMYRGRRYYVSARQLGAAETKEASLHPANQWWRDKQAELDYAAKVEARAMLPRDKQEERDYAARPSARPSMPLEDLAAAALGSRGYSLLALARLVERDAIKARLLQHDIKLPADDDLIIVVDDAEDFDESREAIIRSQVESLLASIVKGEPLPDGITQQLQAARASQVERAIKDLRGESVAAPERTVGKRADEWTRKQRTQAAVGNIVPRRYQKLCQHMAHFVSFLGEANDVTVIDAERIEGFYNFCLARVCDKRERRAGGWSEEHAKNIFNTATRFTRWLWEQNLIELPKSLSGRSKFRFHVNPKDIGNWTAAEIQEVAQKARSIFKLILLLMVNCGLGQKDVSDLAESEVDWAKGTITRKRSKTKRQESVPTVTYRLWPETFGLLKKHRSGSERVLLTETGRPLVRDELVDQKVRRADIVDTKYRKLQKRLTFRKPLKQLRKTGATLLEQFDPSGRVSTLYLGHSPRSMKDKHYSRPDQDYFDRAIAWLGQQFGFVETDPEQPPSNAEEGDTASGEAVSMKRPRKKRS